MKLYYHKDLRGNFGDDLNKLMWKYFFPNAFSGELFHDPKLRENTTTEALFVAIGTILNSHLPKKNKKAIFGAGTGYGEPPMVDSSWETYFVRGPLTAEKLNFPQEKAITDPGMLVSELNLPTYHGSHQISFIPHCSTARTCDWKVICDELSINYIDPQLPPERVLPVIKASKMVITEAMHGAIVADSYRIPWHPIKTNPSILDFKWNDWCSSVNIKYIPTLLPTIWILPESPTLKHKIANIYKRLSGKRALEKILKDNSKFYLSSDAVYSHLKNKLLEQIEIFNADYKLGKYV